ncbi:hypothetical protein [Pseudooceanicola marinus]|uniref:hypothetical protein n=1 Tax=Pseudooceanicola marinus TaxID=396013 RepID=UPI001CD298DB|nr:hypothetical protein [Pseudooceanicola marinus]MCA1335151.1 hypothetical protein [Pseudooceanicola marinus]
MRLELTVPKSLGGQTAMLEALDAVQASEPTRAVLQPILEIVKRALSTGVQQEFFANFERYRNDETLPVQGDKGIRIALDLPDEDLEAARGDLLDVAMAGSERIWQTTSDGQAAAVFEVLCDILEEALPLSEQQPLLDANLSDLAD